MIRTSAPPRPPVQVELHQAGHVADPMQDRGVTEQLNRLDRLFTGFFEWLADQYDPRAGGFYYQPSSRRHPDRFAPDLESTGQGVETMHAAGLLGGLREQERAALAEFFRKHQHPDGYFRFGPVHAAFNTERMLGRLMHYGRQSLSFLEAEPAYPYPQALTGGLGDDALRPRAMRDWFDALPWDNGWLAVDRVSARAQIVQALPAPKRDEAMRLILDELTARQDPRTGLWGDGLPYVKLSGAFKAVLAFRGFRDMPRPDRIYRSLLDCIRHNPAPRVTWVSNTLNLLHAIRPALPAPMSPEETGDVLRLSIDNLSTCLRDDGGFSIEAAGSWAAPNEGLELGLGEVEGDMNSATLAFASWLNLQKLLGTARKAPPAATGFWPRARRAAATSRLDATRSPACP